MNLIVPRKNGFTLIELLIVMAVLGVLASIVLIAINPAEQLAKARDAGRLQAVAQLGHAIQAYYTSQGVYVPRETQLWQDVLVDSGNIKTSITVPLTNIYVGEPCGTTTMQGNICYNVNVGDSKDAFVWTIVESRSEKVRAGGICASNPTGNNALYVWSAPQGKAGLTCVGATSGLTASVSQDLH